MNGRQLAFIHLTKQFQYVNREVITEINTLLDSEKGNEIIYRIGKVVYATPKSFEDVLSNTRYQR